MCKKTMTQKRKKESCVPFKSKKEKLVPFDVVIPNIARSGIAYTVPIKVPVEIRSGFQVLTPTAMKMIESAQLHHSVWLHEFHRKYGCVA